MIQAQVFLRRDAFLAEKLDTASIERIDGVVHLLGGISARVAGKDASHYKWSRIVNNFD